MKSKKITSFFVMTLILTLFFTVQAFASGASNVFTGKITVGSKDVDCIYKIVGDEVQIGDGINPAIEQTVSGDLIIPEEVTYNGTTYSVTSIGNSAFYECVNLTSTGLASNTSVTHVSDSAFAGNTSLEDTGLGTNVSVETLGNSVFYNCTSLTTTGFATNKSITVIPNSAFAMCTSLKDTGLSTNSTVYSILNSAFSACKSLEVTGIGPNSAITSIGNQAFSETAITNTGLANNNSVTTIGEKAFQMCDKLTDTGLLTNTSVNTIGKFAFWYCTSLNSTGLSADSAVIQLGASAFYGCSSLNSYVELPSGLVSPVFYQSYAPNSSDYDVFAETPVRHILFTNPTLTPTMVSDEWRNTFWAEDTQFERASAYYYATIANASDYAENTGFKALYNVTIDGGIAALNNYDFNEQRKGTGFDNKFAQGDLVQITAQTPENYTFDIWESSDVTLEQPTSNLTTFTMVDKDVNIKAIFSDIVDVKTYTITVTQSDGVKIVPETVIVNEGSTQSFTISPLQGYLVSEIIVDGNKVGDATENSDGTYTYTFVNINADHSITATSEDDPDHGVPTTGDEKVYILYIIIATISVVMMLLLLLFKNKFFMKKNTQNSKGVNKYEK